MLIMESKRKTWDVLSNDNQWGWFNNLSSRNKHVTINNLLTVKHYGHVGKILRH